jgi:3-phytase
MRFTILLILIVLSAACQSPQENVATEATPDSLSLQVQPKYITGTLPNDSDDPAIWYNETDPSQSLLLGTDKFEGKGGLYVFNLHGDIDSSRSVFPLDRPNNVDVGYGLAMGDTVVDVAIVAERMTGSIRIFSLPDLTPVDNGGIPVFEDDLPANEVMGIAIYTRPEDHAMFAIVSRKANPVDEDDYLYQYRLDGSTGIVKGELVRKFGKFSGTAEIEAIAVDNELGFVYYSDEMFAIRKYHADPEKGNDELAVFGTEGYTDDREGISIYKHADGTGYILISDQGGNTFRVYPREGSQGNQHDHPEIAYISSSTLSSDGSEVSSRSFGPEFPEGLFVAMSDNGTFQIYDWRDLENVILSQTTQE